MPTLPTIRPLIIGHFLRHSKPPSLTDTCICHKLVGPVRTLLDSEFAPSLEEKEKKLLVNMQQRKMDGQLVQRWLSHTTLELFSCVNLVIRFALEFCGVFQDFNYSGPGGMMFCILFRGALLVIVGSYAGKACVVIHTFDRYWKIVHPIHHRKYYRRWMTYAGMILQ